jgi:hypothetical protein
MFVRKDFQHCVFKNRFDLSMYSLQVWRAELRECAINQQQRLYVMCGIECRKVLFEFAEANNL